MVLLRSPGGGQWAVEGMSVMTVRVLDGGECLGRQVGSCELCCRCGQHKQLARRGRYGTGRGKSLVNQVVARSRGKSTVVDKQEREIKSGWGPAPCYGMVWYGMVWYGTVWCGVV